MVKVFVSTNGVFELPDNFELDKKNFEIWNPQSFINVGKKIYSLPETVSLKVERVYPMIVETFVDTVEGRYSFIDYCDVDSYYKKGGTDDSVTLSIFKLDDKWRKTEFVNDIAKTNLMFEETTVVAGQRILYGIIKFADENIAMYYFHNVFQSFDREIFLKSDFLKFLSSMMKAEKHFLKNGDYYVVKSNDGLTKPFNIKNVKNKKFFFIKSPIINYSLKNNQFYISNTLLPIYEITPQNIYIADNPFVRDKHKYIMSLIKLSYDINKYEEEDLKKISDNYEFPSLSFFLKRFPSLNTTDKNQLILKIYNYVENINKTIETVKKHNNQKNKVNNHIT